MEKTFSELFTYQLQHMSFLKFPRDQFWLIQFSYYISTSYKRVLNQPHDSFSSIISCVEEKQSTKRYCEFLQEDFLKLIQRQENELMPEYNVHRITNENKLILAHTAQFRRTFLQY